MCVTVDVGRGVEVAVGAGVGVDVGRGVAVGVAVGTGAAVAIGGGVGDGSVFPARLSNDVTSAPDAGTAAPWLIASIVA